MEESIMNGYGINLVYVASLILISIGLYCVVVKKNLIKIIIGLGIMEYGVNLFFILIGYRHGGTAPIMDEMVTDAIFVDPLPQALVLTAIVIGLAVTALMAAITVRLYEKYGTLDITEMQQLKG
jgi:multicomponent Na+:H+ antiporter subunit C